MSNPFTRKDALTDVVAQVMLGEKTLTDAEKKKREEIAQAMERENPGMDMGKKMAIATAQAKKVAEEVEELDELSQMKLANYVAKAATSLHNNAKEAGQYDDKENANKAFKRWLGIKSASVRLRGRGELPGKESAIGAYPKMKYKTEEVEQIDELSKDTLKSYVKKAVPDMQNSQKRAEGSLAKSNSELDKGNESKAKKHYGDAEAAHERTQKRMAGIAGAIRRVKANEEIEQEDLEMFLEEYTTMFNEAEDTQQLMLLRAMAQDPSELMKMKRALKAGDKAMTNPVLRGEILKMLDQMMNLTTTDKTLLQRTRAGFQKAKSMPEEVELDEQRVIDMKGKTCTKCSKGKYGKDHPDDDDHYDDLSCKSCGHKTERYTTLLNLAQKKKKTNEEVEQVDEVIGAAIVGGLVGTALGAKGAYHAAKHTSLHSKKPLRDYAKNFVKGVLDPRTYVPKKKTNEEVELIDEAKKTTHEDPLITVHKDGRLHAHAHLSTINDIHGTDVKHTAIHAGGAKVKTKYGDNLEYKLSKHHAKGVQESVDKDAPFEGGREVKSSKSASERVKKIAKGMKKQYTKDKK